MAVLQEYKCPCCGGAISFDSGTQKMKCPFCDTEFDVEALSAYNSELNSQKADSFEWETAAGSEWQEGENEKLRTYVCNSCGGEIVCDDTTAATSCPYCSNPVVMTNNLSGLLKPDLVIPFKITKNAAKDALKKHYKGKRFLPDTFKDENRIDEIKGVYVPFWLFNTDVDANIRYKATRVHTWSDSNFYYTKTSYFSVIRNGNIGFELVPVDGSERMPDDLMESIEPFDFSQAVDFNTAYLAGFLADKYDVDAAQSVDRANMRIKQSTSDAFASTVMGYTSVVPEYTNISLHNGNAKYALYPVWLLNTTYKGKRYTFAMNGQTGKMVGDLPIDNKKYIKWLVGLTGVVSAVCFAIGSLMWFI